jgi:hypothetical protein
LSGVDSHAYADFVEFGNGPLRVHDSRDGIVGALEGQEEAISLRFDLDTSVAFDGFTNTAPVLLQHVAVPIAELLQQTRRSLDVREDQCDGAARELRHGPTLPPLPQDG